MTATARKTTLRERVKQRWRQRRGTAKHVHRDLRDGRPEAPPVEGSPCERCGDWTPDITCILGGYWLCPRCASFFDGLRKWSERVTLPRRKGA